MFIVIIGWVEQQTLSFWVQKISMGVKLFQLILYGFSFQTVRCSRVIALYVLVLLPPQRAVRAVKGKWHLNVLFWELWEEWDPEEEQEQECLKEHRGTFLVSQTSVVILQRWLWYERRWASFKNQCSIWWDDHDLNLCEFSFQSCSVALVTGARM